MGADVKTCFKTSDVGDDGELDWKFGVGLETVVCNAERLCQKVKVP
jgi:hypothetical protein